MWCPLLWEHHIVIFPFNWLNKGHIMTCYLLLVRWWADKAKLLMPISLPELVQSVLELVHKSAVMFTLRSFSSVICSITLLLPSSSVMWYYVHVSWPICMTLHLLEFSFRSHLLDHIAKLFRSSCKLSSPASVQITFQILTSSANILILFLIQSGRSLTKNK